MPVLVFFTLLPLFLVAPDPTSDGVISGLLVCCVVRMTVHRRLPRDFHVYYPSAQAKSMALRPIVDGVNGAKEEIIEQKDNMVLGLLTAIAACPAIIGTTEAVRQGQKKNAKEKHRGQKSNLIAHCSSKSSKKSQIDGGLVVLRNNKVRHLFIPLVTSFVS